MPLDSDSRRWRYFAAAAAFAVMSMMVDAAPRETAQPADSSKDSRQFSFCNRQCTDGDAPDAGMEFHVFAPAAAASAKDYDSAAALISKGYDSTVMGSYEGRCPAGSAEASKSALSARTAVKAAAVKADDTVVQTFQAGPPPPRDTGVLGGGGDTPDAGPPLTGIPPPAPPHGKKDGKKDDYQCLQGPSSKVTMCPGTYDSKEAIPAWDGVMYFKDGQYIFVPCAINTLKGVKTYKEASRLAAENVVYFKGKHGGSGKVTYHLEHEPSGPKR
jgi:hypothetical protein